MRSLVGRKDFISRINILLTARKMTSANTGEDLKVIHDEKNMEFYIKLGEHKAYLQYDILDPKTRAVDLQHTVVPEAFRGQGIAKVLAKEVFDHFVGQNQQMKLTCWYLKKYYKDNPLPHYTEKMIPS